MFDLSWSRGASQFLWMSYLVVGMTKTLEGTGVSIEASRVLWGRKTTCWLCHPKFNGTTYHNWRNKMKTKIINAVALVVLIALSTAGGVYWAYAHPKKDWVHIEALNIGTAVVLHDGYLYELKEIVGDSQDEDGDTAFKESMKQERAHR